MNAVTKITKKLDHLGLRGTEPLLIAGPCSAESEAQILATARALAAGGKTSAFRAGVWKPRTRPGSFEGIGTAALKWLVAAKEETGLPMAIEVANAWHVEEALKHGIDMLWIGARTTVNPFFVQEIAQALQGVDMPVFVKNPLHPELGLWIGAIERLERAGVTKLAAIHRGFYTTKPAPFRNEPRWEMSFELRAKLPELPILCDPSHIAGNRDLLLQVAQTALDINLDGLMIETHPKPNEALSDAAQQLTPDALHALLGQLKMSYEEPKDYASKLKIDAIRLDIDALDHDLIQTLKARFDKVLDIAEVKSADKISVFQMQRWFDMMQERKDYGGTLALDEGMMHEIFGIIHKYSVKKQIEEIRKSDSE